MSFCARCGAAAEPGSALCRRCGAPLEAPAAGETTRAAAAPRYGGFWRRAWAFALDRLLVATVVFPFFGLAFLHALRTMRFGDEPDPAQAFEVFSAFLTLACAGAALGWLYFALMESSAKQATLGKMLLGVRVTDLAGRRVSFGRATARYFCKLLSALILGIGFIMAAFHSRKQALHDLIAGTLVVREGGVT